MLTDWIINRLVAGIFRFLKLIKIMFKYIADPFKIIFFYSIIRSGNLPGAKPGPGGPTDKFSPIKILFAIFVPCFKLWNTILNTEYED